MTPSRRSTAATVPAAFLLANATSYALLLAAAHLLTASDYGLLSSLLSLLLISSIPMMALQTVAARRAAAHDGHESIAFGAVQVAGLATAAGCALTPAAVVFLHLPGYLGILLVVATIPANAALGTAMGSAQGRRQFTTLSALILAAIGGRSIGGLIGLLVGRTPDATLIGVLVGTSAAAVVVLALGPGRTWTRQLRAGGRRDGVFVETLHASHAHGAFLLLTSIDVLLARHVLSSADAGMYAAGSVVTRATLWLPQSVIMIMFASLADTGRHRAAARRAAQVVVVVGAACVAGAAVLGPLIVAFVGGGKYHALDHRIWIYALLGALLAVIQLALLAGLAQRNPRRAALIWATIVVDVVAVLASGVDTPTELVVVLVVVAAAAAVIALGMTWRSDREVAGDPELSGYLGASARTGEPDGTQHDG
jgi:O-antigen/teichoic acid export membrane protein